MADGVVFCATCGARLAPPTVGAPAPGMMPPMQPMQTRGTSGLAIAGFVCSFFCGLAGFVLSILGLSQIKKSNGALGGKGLAIAGIVLSCFSLIGLLAAVSIPAFVSYMHKAKTTEATLVLNRLGKSAKAYFIEHGAFPTGFAPLTPSDSCCHNPGAKCPAIASDWQTPAWRELDFEVDAPSNYQFSYVSTGTSFDATAVGDLDCDEQMATYHLHIEAMSGNPVMTITNPPPDVY
jgi:type II secretory pathway pseudopilin PulG